MLQSNSYGSRMHEGCGAVGRQHNGRRSITSMHKSTRPTTRQLHGLPGGWSSQVTNSRPGSAKYWVEKRWQQQEKQEMKRMDMEKTNNNIRLAQFRANFYNSEPSAPRCLGSSLSLQEEEEETRSTKKLYSLSPPKSPNNVNKNELEKPSTVSSPKLTVSKSYRHILDATDAMLPEVASLKQRLEELHSKNAEERRKLDEELCYRAWKNSNEDCRKMESNRLNEFVRSAWVDQKQWRLDEEKRRQIEEKKFEEEAKEQRIVEEERERRLVTEKVMRRRDLQRELEKQLEMIQLQDKREAELREVEGWLQVERGRIMDLEEKMKTQMHARKSKALAVTWAKQHHIKLKQKAAQVLDDVAEDELLVKEMQRYRGPLPPSLQDDNHFKNYTNSKESDYNWVMSVLSEHKQLEKMRQQEYDLLFSEEAARLFRCRGQQWAQEQRARDSLLEEVLMGRRQQIEEKIKQNEAMGKEVSLHKEQTGSKISAVESEMRELEQREENLREVREEGPDTALTDATEKHRREIARLEREMARLWGPMYKPPSFGRKKSQLM